MTLSSCLGRGDCPQGISLSKQQPLMRQHYSSLLTKEQWLLPAYPCHLRGWTGDSTSGRRHAELDPRWGDHL